VKEAINRSILKLAIPNILTNLTVPLLGLVDLALMGHQGSETYIGALAVGTMIFSLLYSGLMFLRMGTTGFTAQSFGAGRFREAINWLGRGVTLSLLLGIFLIALQFPLEKLIFWLIDGSSSVENLAAEYFRVRIWAAPASLGVFVFSGWFLGMQNARIPLIIALVINVLNIVLSVFFVYESGLGVRGVALGTVLAQYGGLLVAMAFLLTRYRRLLRMLRLNQVFNAASLKHYLSVNSDILIRSVLITGTFFYFNAVSAGMGDMVLSVNSVLLQFLWVFSYFIDGFAFAAESLTGKFIGSRNRSSLLLLIRKLVIWGAILSVMCALINLTLGRYFIGMLTDQTSVIAAIRPYFFWVVLLPLAGFLAFLWDGIYIGSTATASMRNMMLISVLLVFVPARFIFVPLWQNHGLWLSLILFLISRGVLLWLVHRKSVMGKI